MAIDDGVMDIEDRKTRQQQERNGTDKTSAGKFGGATSTIAPSHESPYREHTDSPTAVIPPIFVLNLERAPQRWEKASKEMRSHGLEVVRLEAVDGKKLTAEELSSNITKLAQFLIPRGVVGCYLSHRKFWQMVVDRGLPSAIGMWIFLRHVHLLYT